MWGAEFVHGAYLKHCSSDLIVIELSIGEGMIVGASRGAVMRVRGVPSAWLTVTHRYARISAGLQHDIISTRNIVDGSE